MDGSTPSKIDLLYAERKVIFSICDCSLDKNCSFYGLSREEAIKLVTKLQHIEKMTWKLLAGLPREKGLSPEKVDSPNFSMIDAQNSSEQKITGEKYYFHIR